MFESDEQKQNILTNGEVFRVVVEDRGRQQVEEMLHEDDPSWDFVDDRNPVVATAAPGERHQNDLVQRQRNLVGADVVLDVVRNALPERLDREPEQSALDRDAVPG